MLVDEDRVVTHTVVVAEGKLEPKDPIDMLYLDKVLRAVEDMVRPSSNVDAVFNLDGIAIEKVGAPNPHLGMTNASGIVATGSIVGAVCGWARGIAGLYCPVILIDTAGHGRELLKTYPPELVGPNEPKGTGILRHARSAYDVALAARWHLKVAARSHA